MKANILEVSSLLILQVIFQAYAVKKTGLVRDSNDPNKEAAEKIVMELVKPQHRTIMFVDECNDWEQMDIIEFAKKIDMKFSRFFRRILPNNYH